MVIFSDQADVHGSVFHLLNRLIGGLAGDGNLDVRVFLRERAQIRQKHIFAEGTAGADGKVSDSQLLHFFQLLFALIDGEKRALHLPVEDFSGLGELYPPAGAQKQGGVQALLQPGDRLADSRLTDIKRPRRPGDVFTSRNGDKDMIKIQILFHTHLIPPQSGTYNLYSL